jgi:glycosyltransferase involved in cell wall biosynthesis
VHRGLRENFEVVAILSSRKIYVLRFLEVALRFLWAKLSGKLKSVDAVFVGFFAQPIFPLIRVLWRGPLIADAYFSLYDTMVNDKQKTSSGSLIAKTCFRLDRYMLANADLCFTDTNAHVAYFRQEFSQPTANIKRLWISAENDLLDAPAAYDPSSDKQFEVFFWGGFIPLQGVDTIVQVAGLLKHEKIHFTIFGAGQTFEHCLQVQQTVGATNVDFAGWKSQAAIQSSAGKSHLALGIFGTTEKAGRVIPNKVFEALALGIPLITRESLALDELLQDGRDVLTVTAGNAAKLADKILWVRDHYAEALAIAAQGRKTFCQTAAPSAVYEILRDELEKLQTVRSAQAQFQTPQSPAVREGFTSSGSR